MSVITTFPKLDEFEKAKKLMDSLSLKCPIIIPTPGYKNVGVPAIVMEPEQRMKLAENGMDNFTTSGWVDYHPIESKVPETAPAEFKEDVFGQAAVMVLQPCHAVKTKLRVVAHISGDLTETFPYMNAKMLTAFYNVNGHSFTFMDGYRMITVYPHRIAIAKADDIIDTWRVLEFIRVQSNSYWQNRNHIEPSYELRKKPAALEIYYRLPKINCGACGEKSCLAFALKLWSGLVPLFSCRPVFGGEYGHLKDALTEICAGLGVAKE
jgi:ArsR family metal-binding transcriptional regulator